MESKNKSEVYTNKLIVKTEIVTDVENKHGYQKIRGGINWETGIDIYILLYIKSQTQWT